MDDSELLRRTAAGQREAFDEFFLRHGASVLGFVRGLLRDSALAEDVAQQAFFAAFRRAGTFRGEASARTWLFTIARNAAYRARSKHRQEELSPEPLAKLGVDAGWGSDDPESLVILARRRARLAAALQSLSLSDREVIVLRDIQQLTGPETAEVLGLDLRAMKSRLHRARLRLAAALRAEQGDVGGGCEGA